jgi:hypothetical protein
MSATWPEGLTEPAGRFFDAANDLWSFLAFTRDLADRLDQIGEFIRASKLRDRRLTAEEKREMEEEPRQRAQQALEQWADLLAEMEYSRIVDNYVTYVTELLALVFRTRPETMRSEKQVSFQVVLEHDSMDDLIATLAERQVEQYSRDGLKKLHSGLSKAMGFGLFEEADALQNAARAVEIRNLLVHKRGVVDARFLRQLPDERVNVGDRLKLTEYDASFAASLFMHAVRDTDVRAVEKWDLPTPVAASDVLDLSVEHPRHFADVLALFDRCRGMFNALLLLLGKGFVHEATLFCGPLFVDSLTLAEIADADDTRRVELVVGRRLAALADLEALLTEMQAHPDADVGDASARIPDVRRSAEEFARRHGAAMHAWEPDNEVEHLANAHGRGTEYAAYLTTTLFSRGSAAATDERFSIGEGKVIEIGGPGTKTEEWANPSALFGAHSVAQACRAICLFSTVPNRLSWRV